MSAWQSGDGCTTCHDSRVPRCRQPVDVMQEKLRGQIYHSGQATPWRAKREQSQAGPASDWTPLFTGRCSGSQDRRDTVGATLPTLSCTGPRARRRIRHRADSTRSGMSATQSAANPNNVGQFYCHLVTPVVLLRPTSGMIKNTNSKMTKIVVLTEPFQVVN